MKKTICVDGERVDLNSEMRDLSATLARIISDVLV